MNAVELEGLTIRYGSYTAVDSIDASFSQGAVGLLGRNGAGKSSILKSVLGLVRPAGGAITVLGDRIDQGAGSISRAQVRTRVGYMPERDAWISGLNGYETVLLCGRVAGLPDGVARRRAHDVLWLVGLGEARYRKVATYSAGMRQKVKLAAALAHDPLLLFLDEPTNGLDPAGRQEMLALIEKLVRELGKSVILSTHILPDVERTCSDVVLIDHGQVLKQGSLEELTAEADRRYLLTFGHAEGRECDAAAVRRSLVEHGCEAADAVQTAGTGEALRYDEIAVTLPAEVSTAAVFRAVSSVGGTVRALLEQRRSLEEVFLQSVDAPSGSVGDAVAPAVGVAPSADEVAE